MHIVEVNIFYIQFYFSLVKTSKIKSKKKVPKIINSENDFHSLVLLIQIIIIGGVRFLIECPEKVNDTDNPLVLFLNVDKQIYKYVIR